MIDTHETKTEEKYQIASESFNFDERIQVINYIDTFCIFNRWGDIHPKGKKAHGIFYKGTRYLNRLELQLNNKLPVLLSSSIKTENEVLSVDLTNPDMTNCGIDESGLQINRQQFIRNGSYYEEISLANYSSKDCEFEISLSFGSDFSDIFEIRGMKRQREIPQSRMYTTTNQIFFEYKGLDGIKRVTEIVFCTGTQLSIHRNTAVFDIKLDRKQVHKITYVAYFRSDDEEHPHHNGIPSFDSVRDGIRKEIEVTQALFTGVQTNNTAFNNWLFRSCTDLQSLLATTKTGYYPYAGVPWYNTAFGRDGIITALEVLWVAPRIAKDALMFLAANQSTTSDPDNDAEPGKIIHEMRYGEMANTGEVPFKRYYGTIDSTPLFLVLAGMYYERTADLDTIKEIWPNIKDAVNWIDEFGDVDKDGFVEYRIKSEKGLTNQGWKDSFDSIMYEDGDLAEAPIALCEVQGYVYAAKNYVSVLANAMNEKEYADSLKKAAAALKKNFNAHFWNKELGSFVLALDGDKKPCRVMSSNAGQCLFTGIAEDKYAAAVAERLLAKDMFSGWGIRTLSEKEVRYNPMSYHNGSVWPHDNALIAYGLSRYNRKPETLKIMESLFEASMFMDLQRMPELFCGFDRRQNEGPTHYPVACSPQAWSVGTIYLLLQSCLQLEINAVKKLLVFNKPQLPVFIDHLVISDLWLLDDVCNFEVYRHKHDVSFHFIHKPEDWRVEIRH